MKTGLNAKELRKKTQGELEKLLDDLKGNIRAARFKLIRGELKNVRQPRQLKKSIARVLTILHQPYGKENHRT